MGGGLFAFPETGFTTTGPNLTPDEETGLGRWTEAQFVQAVRGGVRPNGTVMLPFMPWPSYGDWSDEDVHAVWLYLRSLPAVSHAVPPSALRGRAAGAPGPQRGEGLFAIYCVRCHGEGGRGGSVATIPLRDLARDLDEDTIRAFITEGPPGTRMPGFGKTLTADQIADLIAFVRSW
jgi:mono/diheme cytochrome c family protein